VAQQRDPYQVLGVQRTASADEIKKAHRKLVRQYHPDRNPDDAKAEERFKEVQQAYDLLSDPDKRKSYDRGGFGPAGGGQGGGQGVQGQRVVIGIGAGQQDRRGGPGLRGSDRDAAQNGEDGFGERVLDVDPVTADPGAFSERPQHRHDHGVPGEDRSLPADRLAQDPVGLEGVHAHGGAGQPPALRGAVGQGDDSASTGGATPVGADGAQRAGPVGVPLLVERGLVVQPVEIDELQRSVDRLKMEELALANETDPASIDRLERQGYVSRRPNPRDGRGVLAEITQLQADLAAAQAGGADEATIQGIVDQIHANTARLKAALPPASTLDPGTTISGSASGADTLTGAGDTPSAA